MQGATHYSMVVYQHVCRCDCRYVGRTSQRQQDRIKRHMPKAIRNQTQPDRDLFQSNPTSTSAIGQHFLHNEKCVSYYDDNQFSILAKERTLFHLSTLKATLVKMLKVANHHLKARISTKSVKKLKISLAQFIVLFDP